MHPPTFWLTGLSGAGKSTIAQALKVRLGEAQRACVVLDGDHLRSGLCADLGFSPQDRAENIRRVAHVCRLFNDNGLIVIVALISPYARDRALACDIIGPEHFLEVHIATSLQTCESRDPKGLYRKARAGLLKEFTGISAPYEAPANPACALDTVALSLDQCVSQLHALLGTAANPAR